MRSETDSQRQKVYDGEPFSGGQRFESLVEIERYFRHVLGLKIVQRKFGRAACSGSIAALGGGVSRATYHRGRSEPFADPRRKGLSDHTIMFSQSNRNEQIALHELAHHLTRSAPQPHGWEFAAAYLWLVQNRIGAEQAARLKAGWKASGARWTAPRAKRQLSPEQAEANRQRLAEIRARQEAKREAERGEWVIQRRDAEAYGPRISSRAEFEWGEVSGSGSMRGVRYWSTWPKNATVYGLSSSAEKWAAQERAELAEPHPYEISIVSLDEAMANYELGCARRNEHHRKLQAAADEAKAQSEARLQEAAR